MTLRHAMPMSYFEYGTETQAQEEKYLTGMGDKNAIFYVFSRYRYMQICWAQITTTTTTTTATATTTTTTTRQNNITCSTNCK
jgi:hypothetical protein